MNLEPCLPLPNPLKGNESGSFANDTIVRRFSGIVRQTINENNFTPSKEGHLRQLIADIPDGSLRLLEDGRADDWPEYLAPYLGQNWLDVPWLFVEIYFYRRILEAVNYFTEGHDPFATQKEGGLRDAAARIVIIGRELAAHSLDTAAQKRDILKRLIALSLWGNQADMSLFPAGSEHPRHADEEQQASHILADDRAAVLDYLLAQEEPVQVDFLLDNAGFELVGDLFLADFLFQSNTAQRVVLHVKEHPFFVSDALEKDVIGTINWLGAQAEPALRDISGRLQDALDHGRLHITTHPFWTLPTSYWQMPPDLYEQLRQSTLLISKGDLNYRRWLGDLHWEYTVLFTEVVCYAPSRLLALRTLKSDVAAGLRPEDVQRLNEQESDWDTSGRYGVMQFV